MNLSPDIIYRLNYLLKELNCNYSINSGGCCYVAYLIANRLDKYKIKYCLNVECSTKEQFTTNCRENIQNKRVGMSACHYYLRCNNLDINCQEPYGRIVSISSKFINNEHIKAIYNNCNWNIFYNVQDNTTIKNKIYEFFRKEFEDPRRR